MRDLFIAAVYASFFVYGFRAPFVLMLGYVWVDIFTPQLVSYSLLNSVPVSQIIGIAALMALLLSPPPGRVRTTFVVVMMFLLGVWMSLTLSWAVVPDAAFEKWNWAIKSVWVACLIPLFIRGRIELEALIWVILLAGMANCLPFGAKVLISGGGYGLAKGLVAANNGYGEGSTLSMFAVTLIPLCLFLMKHSQIVPPTKTVKVMLAGFIIAALLTSLGTFERTGIVCVAVLAVATILRTKYKITFVAILAVAAIAVIPLLGGGWEDRMRSITQSTDTSAMGRVAAWLWTLDFVQNHPLGGSFRVHAISDFAMRLSNGEILHIKGKAPHNILFEILGEGGIPALLIYLTIAAKTLWTFNAMRRLPASKESMWMKDLGFALLTASIIFLVGGMFIGIAFQSYFYYIVAISAVSINMRITKEMPAHGIANK